MLTALPAAVITIALLLALGVIIRPDLLARLIRWNAIGSGIDFDAMVRDRQRYERRLRWTGLILLLTLLPAWLVFMALLVATMVGII